MIRAERRHTSASLTACCETFVLSLVCFLPPPPPHYVRNVASSPGKFKASWRKCSLLRGVEPEIDRSWLGQKSSGPSSSDRYFQHKCLQSGGCRVSVWCSVSELSVKAQAEPEGEQEQHIYESSDICAGLNCVRRTLIRAAASANP